MIWCTEQYDGHYLFFIKIRFAWPEHNAMLPYVANLEVHHLPVIFASCHSNLRQQMVWCIEQDDGRHLLVIKIRFVWPKCDDTLQSVANLEVHHHLSQICGNWCDTSGKMIAVISLSSRFDLCGQNVMTRYYLWKIWRCTIISLKSVKNGVIHRARWWLLSPCHQDSICVANMRWHATIGDKFGGAS